MPDSGNKLTKIMQGGALFMAGSMGGMALQFIIGIIVIRVVTPTEYGRISLGYIVVGMAAIISTLGFSNGLPRFIAKYSDTPDQHSLSSVVSTALLMVIATSIFMTMLLYGLSDNMAFVYKKPQLEMLLNIFMLMISPMAIVLVLNSIFRGLETALPQAIFSDGLLSTSRLVLLMGVAIMGFGYEAVLGVYVLSTWIAFGAYLFYALRTLPRLIGLHFNGKIAAEMLKFSLPLLGIGLMSNLVNWAGTLVLGYYGTNQDVGLFNAPLRLTTVIATPLAAVVYLYLPVATRLIETHAHDELEELYVSATKWSFLLTFPLTLYILVDAEFIVTHLFGNGYQGSADLLRILTLGASLNTLAGPNGMTLVAHGDTRTVFHSTVLAGLSTIGLSMLLVPGFGIVGAALGTALAQLVANGFISVVLYSRYRIHPFTANYIKPIILAFLLSAGVHYLFGLTSTSNIAEHIALLLAVGLIALLAPWATRSVTAEDIALIASLERRLHNRTSIADKLGAWITPPEARVPSGDREENLYPTNILPNLIVAGAPKCGTTALFDYLADHPQICPSSIKETRYLIDPGYPLYPADRNFSQGGLAGYSEFFRDYRPERHKICFEATPDYIYQNTALETLGSLNPLPTIIFMLRKPSARVYSLYQFARNNMASLDASVTFGRFLDMLATDATYLHERPIVRNAIEHSKYSHYLARWYETFGRDHVHVLLLEDLIADPAGFMKKLANLLNIDGSFYDNYEFVRKNESLVIRNHTLHRLVRRRQHSFSSPVIRRFGKMMYDTYEHINVRRVRPGKSSEEKALLKRLDKVFDDEIDALRKLTGLDLGQWRSQ